MRPMRSILLFVSLALILAPAAMATESITYCQQLTPLNTNWDRFSVLPKFDPSLGTLVKVELNGTLNWTQIVRFEHVVSESDANITIEQWVYFELTMHDSTLLTNEWENSSEWYVTKYDNLTDFGGTSGFNFTNANLTSTSRKNYTDCDDISEYIARFPGETKNIRTRARATVGADGSGNYVLSPTTSASSIVCVTYYYDAPTCIEGYKLDAANNQPLEGWNITLQDCDGKVIGWDITNQTGHWKICGLQCCNFSACEILKPGWIAVDPPSGCYLDLNSSEGNLTGYNFTNKNVSCISGYKINNCTGEGLENWTISLKNETGVVINTTETDGSGYYQFCDLVHGNYTVCEDVEDGWHVLGDRCIDVILGYDNVTDQNFTNTPLLCIEGNKHEGCLGINISNWTIRLYNETYAEIANTTTNDTGRYSFCDLVPGTYTVCEDTDPNWANVTPVCYTVIDSK